MSRSLAALAAQWTPKFVKDFVHGNNSLDRLTRKTFGALARAGGSTLRIESGPMAGLSLVPGEHVSHAHIRGTYELETQQAIDSLVRPGFVCYDLGASIGYMSILMARKARQVFAFEPAPHAIAEIRKHAAANGFTNIDVVPSPVSDCRRTVEFGITDAAFGSCIVEGESRWPTIELETITLDEFAASHPMPDFIKIDVEGEEGRVLRGASTVLASGRTLICCELHSVEAANESMESFRRYNYTVLTLDGKPFKVPHEIVAGDVQVIGLPRK